MLRGWRLRRRLSQLDLAGEAGISARHLSFVETGRAQPSREMLLHLAERLDVPMRERNVLLVAAGYAPVFPERSLADPALASARAAIDLVLERQKPYPAFALDRRWQIVASNGALPELYDGVAADLLQPPVERVAERSYSYRPNSLFPNAGGRSGERTLRPDREIAGVHAGPWRPALERHIGRAVSGIPHGDGFDWTIGRGRGGLSL